MSNDRRRNPGPDSGTAGRPLLPHEPVPVARPGLPDGYVERAVAEILASTDAAGVPAAGPRTHVPFSFCPGCAARLSDPASFVQEYWVGSETRFMVWCRSCRGTFTVTRVDRYEGNEALD